MFLVYLHYQPKVFEFNNDTIECSMAAHSFLSVQSYLCIFSRGCFESLDNSDVSFSKVLTTDSDRMALITAHKATLTTAAIDHLMCQ